MVHMWGHVWGHIKTKKSKKTTNQQSLHVIDRAPMVLPPWVRAPLMRRGLEKKKEDKKEKKVTVLGTIVLSRTVTFLLDTHTALELSGSEYSTS